MENKIFGKNLLNKLKEEIKKKGNILNHDELYSAYISVGGKVVSTEKLVQGKILRSFFYCHKIPVKKENNTWTFCENILEIIEQRINNFHKKKDDFTTHKKVEKENQEKTIEVILQSNNLTEEALDKLLGGKILQQKRGLYKIEVPIENKKKLFSFWMNSEINGLGSVMIDIKVEKEFEKILEKL